VRARLGRRRTRRGLRTERLRPAPLRPSGERDLGLDLRLLLVVPARVRPRSPRPRAPAGGMEPLGDSGREAGVGAQCDGSGGPPGGLRVALAAPRLTSPCSWTLPSSALPRPPPRRQWRLHLLPGMRPKPLPQVWSLEMLASNGPRYEARATKPSDGGFASRESVASVLLLPRSGESINAQRHNVCNHNVCKHNVCSVGLPCPQERGESPSPWWGACWQKA